MASTTGLNQNDTNDASSSYFQKTVCLHDWWLIKAEKDFKGKRLAVAGFTSREQQAVRVFSSAPIVKSYDVFTLETADRICVILKGFINKLRTTDNGFPSEVFSHFVFGFPPYWEEYAAKLLEGDSTAGVLSGSISDSDEFATDPGIAGKKNVSLATAQTPNNRKQVTHEDKHGVGALKGHSHNMSENITVDASNSSNLHNHATKVETKVNVRPSNFWSRRNARLRNLKGNSKNDPESRSSIKHKNTKLSSTSETFENPDGAKLNSSSGTTIQSGKKDTSDNFPCHSMGRMFGKLSVDARSTQKEERQAVNGSKSKRNKISSLPLVSDDVSNIVRNNNCEFEGIGISNQSADELQAPMHENVLREVYAECAEDGSLQNSDAKHALNCRNIMTQGDMQTRNNNSARSPIGRVNTNHTKDLKNAAQEGESNAKEESMCSKKTIIFSPESLSFGRSRSGRPLVPALEFWRNQVPVYDADRKMTGIKDDLVVVVGPSRGSRSEPQKKRKQ